MGVLLVAAVALALLSAAAFIGSGVYNIGADDHHTKLVLALISELRERSIARRARAIEVPGIEDPARIAAGARPRGDSTIHRSGTWSRSYDGFPT